MSEKPFVPPDFEVPAVLETNKFRLRMLSVDDVEKDYEAVMESQALLRANGGDWPRDGFTLGENLDDLQWHEQEHLEKIAFTYTIMNPEETFCLGCIYINPLLQEMVDIGICQFQDKDEEGFAARISYWVRQSRSTREFNATILENIIQWLDLEWYFDCVVFPNFFSPQ